MKRATLVIGLLIVGILVLSFGFSSPDKDSVRASINGGTIDSSLESDSLVPVNTESSSFEFEGYGPGKSHVGTFTEIEGNLEIKGNQVTGMEGTIQTDSVSTGIDGLDNHLKQEDFFDIANYPEIHFISKTIDNDEMAGVLTFRGVSKGITFPVETTEDSITADFILDTTPFGEMNSKVNKEVRIAFNFQA